MDGRTDGWVWLIGAWVAWSLSHWRFLFAWLYMVSSGDEEDGGEGNGVREGVDIVSYLEMGIGGGGRK